MKVNSNFLKMPESYLFSEVAARIKAFREANPGKEVIRMDIGDVTLPLPSVVIEEMKQAAADLGESSTFIGYGPEQGHTFLREAIAATDYRSRGIDISETEIFISDGAKSDIGNVGDLFDVDNVIGLANPGYPVYFDANVIDGRKERVVILPCTQATDFKPQLPSEDMATIDVIYLCYPNNPTGVVLTREELQAWVDYAKAHDALIIFDSAYEAYISDENIPRSIYEIPGARKVAIEVRSFSKTAGFTGVRCGYTVVPEDLKKTDTDGNEVSLNKLWRRRQSTKFNGASYIVQRGACALYSPAGRKTIEENVGYYMRNACALRDALQAKGLIVYGGENSPYVWFKAPKGMTSWEAFDFLLEETGVSSTPGVGFGPEGEGWLRLTGFNSYEKTLYAISKINNICLI